MDLIASIPIESGRAVVVPSVRPPVLMPDLFFCAPVDVGSVYVYTHVEPVGENGRRVVRSFRLSREKHDDISARAFIHSPYMLIGDAIFVYMDRRKNEEYERAVMAARSEKRMAGSYRTSDGQVGACIRTALKDSTIDIYVGDGKIEMRSRWALQVAASRCRAT